MLFTKPPIDIENIIIKCLHDSYKNKYGTKWLKEYMYHYEEGWYKQNYTLYFLDIRICLTTGKKGREILIL
jgi:hypothetical protein